MSEHIPDQVEDIDDDRPTPKLDALVNEQTDLFQDPDWDDTLTNKPPKAPSEGPSGPIGSPAGQH